MSTHPEDKQKTTLQDWKEDPEAAKKAAKVEKKHGSFIRRHMDDEDISRDKDEPGIPPRK